MTCVYGWSNNSFDSLIKLLVEALPEGNVLPNPMYEIHKTIRDLGLDYVKIDACVNDCILFRGEEYENLDKCPKCGESRWQEKKKKNVVPNKVVRYFLIKPRLQRLFMSKQIADDMKWHKNKRVDDGVMRHPADSLAWKRFDDNHELFASDPRNVRLGLASDGFNSFGIMSTNYSVWPVVLIPYNLPPWLCMKQPNFILTLLIPGPKGLGIDIDVYLQPLIDDLKDLWDEGIETYDASSRQNFQLHAALLWTINDFPAYAISGWSTKGKLACPCCHSETSSCRLKYGHKQCYMGHRRFLPTQHPWRMKKSPFDNTRELRIALEPVTGDQVIAQLESLELLPFGKATRKRKRIANVNHNWKKKSIFFELPYWRTNLLRHNIDMMHVEKNICESVIGTLLDLEGKTKDTIKSRLDLQRMGLKKQLHPIKDVRFPDAYASNIGRCVNINELKIPGLKSHDYHVILERLLPLAIRGLLPKDACDPLIELSLFFGDLCSKELELNELDPLHNQIVVTLCKLERIFPPSFFNVMVHLSIHLANEAKTGGPVQYRWMYPIEREHMAKIKNESHRNIEKRHKEQFPKWFENEVLRLQQLGDERISKQLEILSKGPDFRVFNHKGYILNGFKFRTKDAEKHLKTQNSGVIVKGDELTGHVDFYGVVRKITEIRYLNSNFAILFECDWFEAPSEGRNQGMGYRRDEYGFISIEMTKLYYKSDPYILASQAGLVYYVKYNDKENWYTVVKVKPRHVFNLPNVEVDDDLEAYQLNELGDTHGQLKTPLVNQDEVVLNEDDDAPLVNQDDEVLNRHDVAGLCLDESIIDKEEEQKELDDASDSDSEEEESHASEYDLSEKEDSDTE
ncbi:uncharacterized protein LOC130736195 [Lotus japonicus]|uniref:uncharacterized protein LOC130736195 n=1 Tax=Lotus japonicus TaxID=34305 RepID=UPI00258A3117|nr:uncharacterized protein LOC130736195 [Lotus japonicus]